MSERPQSFDMAVWGERRKLRAFAVKITGDPERADDLVQDAIVRALDKWDYFKAGTNLSAWLMTIMRNHHFGVLRKRRREVEDIDGKIAASVAVDEGQTSVCDLRVVRKQLRLLKPEHRHAFELVVLLGYEYEEAAIELNVPVGTVKSRIHRARSFIETGAEPPPEHVEEIVPALTGDTDSVVEMYRAGRSVSEIAAAIPTFSKSEIMMLVSNIKRKVA